MTAGTIVAFTTVQARLMFPLLGLMRVALDLQTSQALFARIFEYLDLKPAIVDRARPRMPVDQARPRPGRVRPTSSSATRMPAPVPPPTLDDVSFAIEPGQFAAFVGPSGAGKTTIVLPRSRASTRPPAARVRSPATTCATWSRQSSSSHIGIVSQETYLFHATIAENLRYAKPGCDRCGTRGGGAGREHPRHDRSFPDGYDTIVGERGYRLSGGEKQRIAIARVLLKDPAVLILDEATSALDSVSERIVQEALDAASRGRTTIAIAHRLSTVLDADVIFVIDGGRLVERGTHAELIAAGGEYARLYTEQVRAR